MRGRLPWLATAAAGLWAGKTPLAPRARLGADRPTPYVWNTARRSFVKNATFLVILATVNANTLIAGATVCAFLSPKIALAAPAEPVSTEASGAARGAGGASNVAGGSGGGGGAFTVLGKGGKVLQRRPPGGTSTAGPEAPVTMDSPAPAEETTKPIVSDRAEYVNGKKVPRQDPEKFALHALKQTLEAKAKTLSPNTAEGKRSPGPSPNTLTRNLNREARNQNPKS